MYKGGEEATVKKALFLALGCLGLGLGALGAALPMLPAFPFLVLAAFAFAKSSPRLHKWFVGTRLYKENLESFVRGRGMTVKTKLRAIAAVTVTMGFGFVMMHNVPVGRIILSVLWLFHLLYFAFGVKTINAPQANPSYPYCTRVVIAGMQGKPCATRLENALNGQEQSFATVSYRSRTAILYTKEPPNRQALTDLIQSQGYRVAQYQDSGCESDEA